MEGVPERWRHICIDRDGERQSTPSVSSCEVDASASNALTHLFSAEICSSSPPLLALQGCQGAGMIPAGETSPSRHKLGCPKPPQAAQLYSWSGSIWPGQSLHTPSLHHPEMGCPTQACPVPSAVRAGSPQAVLGECCPSPLPWDSLVSPLHSHPSTGAPVLHLPPSLSPFGT